MNTPDIIKALTPVIDAFEKLSIAYHIGGSIASSLYGIARATLDVDLVADIKHNHVPLLKDTLKTEYYVDEIMINDAIRNKSSFNLIHLDTMIKIDVFLLKEEPYQHEALQRRRKDTIIEGGSRNEFFFSSPEDVILSKLQWYKMSGGKSDRQWLDIIGIIKVQSNWLIRMPGSYHNKTMYEP